MSADKENISKENYLLVEAGGHYAFPLEKVDTVARAGRITEIPGAQPYVDGLMNYRNEIYTMLNFKKLMGLPDDADTGEHMAVMLEEKDNRCFGIFVDRINGVGEIDVPDIKRIDIGGKITGFFSYDTEVRENADDEYKTVKTGYKIVDPDSFF